MLKLQLPDPVERLLNRYLLLAHESLIGVAPENHLICKLFEQPIGGPGQLFMLNEQGLGNRALSKVFPGEVRRYRGAYQRYQQDKCRGKPEIEKFSLIHESVAV